MIDVRICEQNFQFKYRVSAVIKKNDKYLFVKHEYNDFYCLPGGHVELCEDSINAVKREVLEEVRVKTKNEKLFLVMENFYTGVTGKHFHEVAFYYIVETDDKISENDFSLIENDKGVVKELKYHWVSLDEIQNLNLKPSVLKDCLKDNNGTIKHIILHENK